MTLLELGESLIKSLNGCLAWIEAVSRIQMEVMSHFVLLAVLRQDLRLAITTTSA